MIIKTQDIEWSISPKPGMIKFGYTRLNKSKNKLTYHYIWFKNKTDFDKWLEYWNNVDSSLKFEALSNR